ncbi:MAG TPA: hypothetical protein VJ833_13910 [Rhodanobacteraceae bacterium]|nr:hypothetical protein [Rhodanobacteraceae bacterium]
MWLAACSGDGGGNHAAQMVQSTAPSSPAGAATAAKRNGSAPFASEAWRFRIDVPPGWVARHHFRSSYLANDTWKTFASPDSRGQPVLALTVPGSNNITDAEIRIGASRDPMEVHDCTTPPSAVRSGSVATRTINGITFTTFDAADAAMSHHLDVHAYRTVHHGACYAIDLLVFGVNPAVYDPPATPPFSDTHAFAAMREVLQSLKFMETANQPAASASTVSR